MTTRYARCSNRLNVFLLAAATIACLPGCASLKNDYDSVHMNVRDQWLAMGAWKRAKPHFEEHSYRCDLEKGFKAGYISILNGGNGCPPTVPPRCYWGVHYQSHEGKAQIAAWYEGYSYGTMYAEQEGVEDLTSLPIQVSQPLYPEHPAYRDWSTNLHVVHPDDDPLAPIPDERFDAPIPLPLTPQVAPSADDDYNPPPPRKTGAPEEPTEPEGDGDGAGDDASEIPLAPGVGNPLPETTRTGTSFEDATAVRSARRETPVASNPPEWARPTLVADKSASQGPADAWLWGGDDAPSGQRVVSNVGMTTVTPKATATSSHGASSTASSHDDDDDPVTGVGASLLGAAELDHDTDAESEPQFSPFSRSLVPDVTEPEAAGETLESTAPLPAYLQVDPVSFSDPTSYDVTSINVGRSLRIFRARR